MSLAPGTLIAPERPDVETLNVSVLKVFDGDGFLAGIGDARSGTRLEFSARLGFIDAPEMDQPGGREARDFLQALIGGKRLDIVPLIKMDTGGIVDRHRRIVCVAYLTDGLPTERIRTLGGHADVSPPHRQITRNIELEMLLNGWAWLLERYEPEERYFDALHDARSHRRGIWAYDDNVHPWEFKKQRYRAKQTNRNVSQQGDLFRPVGQCPMPACGGHLLKRSGRFGPFAGCSKFPSCKYTCPAN